MRRIKFTIVALVVALFAVGCHTGIHEEDNQQHCAGVSEAVDAVQEATISHPPVRSELMNDLNELGADGHCPGYNPNDSDTDG